MQGSVAPREPAERRHSPHDEVSAIRPEETIRKVRPAMFRKHPVRFVLYLTLLVVGIAAAVYASSVGTGDWLAVALFLPLGLLGGGLLAWWWTEIRFTTLTVTTKRTIYSTGILSRRSSEVRHDDVRNLQMDQSALERILGVGNIAISSAGQSGLEIVAEGIPHPETILGMIRERQH